MRLKNTGFTIVELIIVTLIIAILASIGIPYLVRVKVQGNESAARSNLRTFSSSAESFRTTQNPPRYPLDVNELINSNPSYLDSTWGNNQRQGYTYNYSVSGVQDTYAVSAAPLIANVSGVNSYCVDQTGVVRSYPPGSATGSATGCDANGTPI
ncbi:MAG: prepilin-type N-terminal cleavage/methylation domain-containing protein [Candidatus Omnitrophica bacterium]|nr:prepilin-type N-terminal cleavage/methylation domain-containing protein [Candidatus Omnitrophota bacterium]